MLLHHSFEVKGIKSTSENLTTDRARSSHSGLQGWILCKGKVSLDTIFLQYSLALAQHLTSTYRCSRPESGSTFHWDVKRFINNWKQCEKVPPLTNIYIHDVWASVESGREPSLRNEDWTKSKKKNLHTHELLLRGLMTGDIKLGTIQQTDDDKQCYINK